MIPAGVTPAKTMRPVTLAVHEDEKAWKLRERILAMNGPYRRFQIITVVRDDKLTEWWNDMGLEASFTAPEMEIPSLFVYSVAKLRDMADNIRWKDDHLQRFMAEKNAESTLVEDWLTYLEENWARIYNKSSFGPGVTKQRNGFSRRAAYEQERKN